MTKPLARVLLLLCAAWPALAQTPTDPPYSTAQRDAAVPSVPLVYDTGCNCFRPIDISHPLPVSGVAIGCAGQPIANTVLTPISQTGNTKLLSKASAKSIYVCAIMVVAGDAENVSLLYGTQSSTPCDTSPTAMIGGATAAAGANLAANGGFNAGTGQAVIALAAPNTDVCLFQSGSGRVAGYIVGAQF
jgi:hypothetical protein